MDSEIDGFVYGTVSYKISYSQADRLFAMSFVDGPDRRTSSVADLGFEQRGVHERGCARQKFLPTTPTLAHFRCILTSTQFHFSRANLQKCCQLNFFANFTRYFHQGVALDQSASTMRCLINFHRLNLLSLTLTLILSGFPHTKSLRLLQFYFEKNFFFA